METVSEVETSCLLPPTQDHRSNKLRCSTGSIGTAACINSNGVQYDKQIHDDQTSSK